MTDNQFYREMWNTHPHFCEECGTFLRSYSASYISHILTKGAWPQHRHNPKNINILCYEHHHKWEFGHRKGMKIWEKNEPLIESLKRECYAN